MRTPAASMWPSIPTIPIFCLPRCGRRGAPRGVWQAAARAADFTARMTGVLLGSGWKNMVCRKVRTDASGSPWELTLIEFMHSSRRTILMAASTAPTMAARLGISSIPAIACGSGPGITCTSSPTPGTKTSSTSWMWRRISRPMAGTCLTGSEFHTATITDYGLIREIPGA